MSYAKNQAGFYYIEIRLTAKYKTFRTQRAGEKDGIERVGGQRADGVWETVKWLVSREMAHVENGKLVADHSHAKELFDRLDAEPKFIEGNRFKAQERVGNIEKVVKSSLF